jgi:hypothetical protein
MIRKNFTCDNDYYKVTYETFEDTTDLSKYLENAETNNVFQYEGLSSKQSKSSGFNDFESLEDAMKALEYGTEMYFEDFNKNFKKANDYITKREELKKSNFKKDVVGFIPIVPNTIIGNPINMISSDIKPKPYPTAKIIIEKANLCGVRVDDMCRYYATIFALISLLEKRGIRCEIWGSGTFKENHEIYATKIKLKSYTQPLNSYKIQFPIISADMFRRIMFRLLETNPGITDSWWTDGYGHTLITSGGDFRLEKNGIPTKDLKELLELNDNDVFIPNGEYFDCEHDSIEVILNKIIKGTNLNKYIKLND